MPNDLDSSDLLRCRETINFVYSTLEHGQSLHKQIQAKHDNLYTGLNVLKPGGENCKQYLKQLNSQLEPTAKEISEKLKLAEETFALIKQRTESKDAVKKEASRKERSKKKNKMKNEKHLIDTIKVLSSGKADSLSEKVLNEKNFSENGLTILKKRFHLIALETILEKDFATDSIKKRF